MTKISQIAGSLVISMAIVSGAHADNHMSSSSGGVIGLTDVVVSDMAGYVAAIKRRPDVFSDLGASLAGVCSAITGADVPGEAVVYTLFPSMQAGLTAVNHQLTSASYGDFANSLAGYRELTGNRIQQTLKASPPGQADTWAGRSLYISTNDIDSYIEALTAYEEAFHENGFNDIALNVYQEIGSGITSELLSVLLVAPSLSRLGELLDVAASAEWATEAFVGVVEARTGIGEDKMYYCQTVFSAM